MHRSDPQSRPRAPRRGCRRPARVGASPVHRVPESRVAPESCLVDEPTDDPWGRLVVEGWFRRHDCLPRDAIGAVAAGLSTLLSAGHPPHRVLVDPAAHPALWTVIGAAAALVSPILGDAPRLLPNLWVHWIDGGRWGRRGGWPRHRDQSARTVFGPPDMPILASLSLWIPLTPATADNGAMRVLPLGCDRTVRVLPAMPGDLLGWRQDVEHWGGRFDPVRAHGPRAALAVEMQSRSFAPFETPLLDPAAPPLPSRLAPLVARTARRYGAFDRSADRAAARGGA